MGIVNVTPDSFSDGGRYAQADAARAHCDRLVAQGADILDIGGESTRPGARLPDTAEQLARVLPVLRHAVTLGVPVSVDTADPVVMARGAGAGRRHPQRRARAAGARRAGRGRRASRGRRLPDAHAGRARLDAGRAALRRRRRRRRRRRLPGRAARRRAGRRHRARAHRARSRASASARRRRTIWRWRGSSAACWSWAVRCCWAGRASPRWASSPAGRWTSASRPAWPRRWPPCTRARPSCACTTSPRPWTR